MPELGVDIGGLA